jgi:hypothetical protein
MKVISTTEYETYKPSRYIRLALWLEKNPEGRDFDLDNYEDQN